MGFSTDALKRTTPMMALFLLAYIMRRWVYSFYFLQVTPVMAALLPLILRDEEYDTALSVLLAGQLVWFLMFLPFKPLWLIEGLSMLGLGEVPWG